MVKFDDVSVQALFLRAKQRISGSSSGLKDVLTFESVGIKPDLSVFERIRLDAGASVPTPSITGNPSMTVNGPYFSTDSDGIPKLKKQRVVMDTETRPGTSQDQVVL